jgi:ADP-heptose:LPS heptosyltransferase
MLSTDCVLAPAAKEINVLAMRFSRSSDTWSGFTVPGESLLTVTAARLASIPFRIFARRPFTTPHKVLILKPCCMSQVMLATPLLAALSDAFPKARFDWAVAGWARPALATNPRLSEVIDSGALGMPGCTWADVRELVARLRREQYDTCFVPSRSSLLALAARMAGIPQRVGLNVNGRGFTHTIAVGPPAGEQHEAVLYLALAEAIGVEITSGSAKGMEFYPTDSDRTAVTERLIDEIDWLGEVPLILLHPGGGCNPVRPDERKRWPAERYALLGNYLARRYKACVLIVGGEEDCEAAAAVAGMMSAPHFNLAGRLSLGELGALCEVADLYVGNDAGPTQVAAAIGCPTLAIFGPSDPAVSGPYVTRHHAIAIRPEVRREPFSWEGCVSAGEAIEAADQLLMGSRQNGELAGVLRDVSYPS